MESSPKPRQKSYHQGSSLYFTAGLIFSMVLITTAFEWKTPFKLLSNEEIDITQKPDNPEDFVVVVLPEPPRPKVESPEIDVRPDNEPLQRTEPVEIDPPVAKVDTFVIGPPTLTTLISTPKPPETIVEFIDYAEVDAAPLGGDKAFYEFLSKNIQYPRRAQSLGIEGTVYVRFIIDEKGNVTQAETLPDRELLGYGLDEEAIRVIKLTKWTPAKHGGKTVKLRKVLPVKFKLQR